jgi:hypothetical protein
MNIEKHVPSWAWDYYQALQTRASKTHDDSSEEALSFIVALIIKGQLPLSEAELDRVVDNHLAGERQKQRRRNELLEKYAVEPCGKDVSEHDWHRELIETLYKLLSAAQWQLLYQIATGRPYQEISKESNTPVGTLKSKVSRARSTLRKSCMRIHDL